jgi:hypothetical protein
MNDMNSVLESFNDVFKGVAKDIAQPQSAVDVSIADIKQRITNNLYALLKEESIDSNQLELMKQYSVMLEMLSYTESRNVSGGSE